MRLTFHTDGGFAVFPGLQRPFVINTTSLAADDAAQLEQLVADATSRHLRAGTTGADQITYTIDVVDDQHRRHSLRATDPVADPALRALIDRLSDMRAASAASEDE